MKITSTELENWGKTRESQEKLPLLLRKLITNSIDGKYLVNINIPCGDSIWKPGVDGKVQTLEHSILGEAGIYYVECGQSNDCITKFKNDLLKRSNALSVNSNITFVFITTHKVKNKDRLISQVIKTTKHANFWKNIKIFDADDIETWLDNDYATKAWIFDILKKPFDGIYNFEKKWSEWLSSTVIPLDEDIILARKNIYTKEISNWLLSDGGLLEVRSNTKKESLLYLLASINKISPAEKQEEIKSKITIVEDQNQWYRIVDNGASKKLILVPMFDVPEGIHALKDRGYTIYFPLDKKTAFQIENRLDIGSICNYILEPIVEKKYGYDLRNKIYKSFRDEDILLLQRILRKNDAPLPKPKWVSKENASILLFCSMFSSWNNRNTKDIEIIEKTLKMSYSDIKDKLVVLTNIEESPIQQIDNIFQVTNPKLIIEHLGLYLSQEFLNRLLQSIKIILTTIDTDYTKEKNYLYDITVFENKEKYSKQIKASASQGLSLFSNNEICFNKNIRIKEQINTMINAIFENNNYSQWLSLNPYIQMLFEAAPKIMLSQTNKMLNDKIILNKIIEYSSVGIGGNCYYAGILWGLEAIAWNSEYIRRVTETLLKMQKKWKYNSEYSNSPISSLHKIYCLWCPHTSANIEQRKEVIRTLIESKKYNDVIIKLLIKLIPHNHDIISSSIEPMYLKFHKNKQNTVDFYNFYDFIFEQLLILLEQSNEWHILLEHYLKLPSNQKEKLYSKLISLNFEMIQDDKKIEIDKVISSKTSWFDRYGKNKDYSLEDRKLINKLRLIKNKIIFIEKYKSYIALFTICDYQKNDIIYIEALKDVLSTDGINGVVNLAKYIKVYEPRFTNALRCLTFSADQLKVLFSQFNKNQNVDKILFNFIRLYFYNNEMLFIKKYWNNKWNSNIKQGILLSLRYSSELWNWIEENNLDKLYWRKVILRGRFDPSDLEFILNKLKKHNNQNCLLEIIYDNKDNVSNDNIIYALQYFDGKIHHQLNDYYILELFNVLYINNIETNLLLQLEIKYLDVFEYKTLPKVLKKEIANPDSILFCEIIKEAYKEDNSFNSTSQYIEISETKKQVVDLAIELIIRITNVFIFDDYSCINDWFNNNIERIKNINRFNTGISVIGEIFGRSPNDQTDRIWPIKEIRNIIENEENDKLEKGILIGKHNSIGLRSITPEAKDMWTAYNKYKNFAKSLEIKYPRTAEIVEKIANDYKCKAEGDENSYKQKF